MKTKKIKEDKDFRQKAIDFISLFEGFRGTNMKQLSFGLKSKK